MNTVSEKLILVIDDSKDNLSLLELLFTSRGHQVYCAPNGLAAISLLQELSSLPDLILLDAQMPIMDGYQFRTEQKKNVRLRDIPVLVMTGDDDALLSQKMDHPEGILLKPLKFKTLIDKVEAYL